TSTARPARAKRRAATNPLGPAPTTMASAAVIAGSQLYGQRLRGSHDGHRALRKAADRPFDLAVGAVRSMVEERDLARPGHGPQADRVLGGGMAEGRFSLHLLGPEMRVVDEEIDVVGELERRLVVLADPTGPGSKCRRAMIGNVADRRMVVAHAEAHGVPTLVGDIESEDTEALDRKGLTGNEAESPVAPEFR